MTTVKFPDLLYGFDFVSASAPFESSAYIESDTGEIFYVSSMIDREEDNPADLETSDQYIGIPHKSELNLGRDLALSFVEEVAPADFEKVAAFFHSKSAYRRFKDFLAWRSLLDGWYKYEASATEKVLREWCQENDIAITAD